MQWVCGWCAAVCLVCGAVAQEYGVSLGDLRSGDMVVTERKLAEAISKEIVTVVSNSVAAGYLCTEQKAQEIAGARVSQAQLNSAVQGLELLIRPLANTQWVAQVVGQVDSGLSAHIGNEQIHLTLDQAQKIDDAYAWGNHAQAGYMHSFVMNDVGKLFAIKGVSTERSGSSITDYAWRLEQKFYDVAVTNADQWGGFVSADRSRLFAGGLALRRVDADGTNSVQLTGTSVRVGNSSGNAYYAWPAGPASSFATISNVIDIIKGLVDTQYVAQAIAAIDLTPPDPAWQYETVAGAGSIAVTNALLDVDGSGDLELTITGLKSGVPTYTVIYGADSLSISNAYWIGGGVYQSGRKNHYMVWQYGDEVMVNPITTTE